MKFLLFIYFLKAVFTVSSFSQWYFHVQVPFGALFLPEYPPSWLLSQSLLSETHSPLWHFKNVLESPEVKETHLDLTWHFSWSWVTPHLPHFSLLTPHGISVLGASRERAGLFEQGKSRAAPGFLFSLIFLYSPKHVFTDSDFKVSFPKNVTFTSGPWTFSLFFFLLLNEVPSNLLVIQVSAQLPSPSGSPPWLL